MSYVSQWPEKYALTLLVSLFEGTLICSKNHLNTQHTPLLYVHQLTISEDNAALSQQSQNLCHFCAWTSHH